MNKKNNGHYYVATSVVSFKIKRSPESVKKIYDTYFTFNKEERVSRCTPQSIAGLVACKKAIVKVVREVFGLTISPKSIILQYRVNASPVIAFLHSDTGGLKKNMHVSVSHTKTHAFGLAVLTVEENTDE